MPRDIFPRASLELSAAREKLAPDIHDAFANFSKRVVAERGPMIRIKRTYEPATRQDGQRFLIERLWPRGMKKEALAMDGWLKDVAPSTELRQWFGHRPERWEEFRRRYKKELSVNADAWKPLLEAGRKGTVTLLYSAHDTEHNGAIVMRDFLLARARRGSTSTPRSSAARSRGSAKHSMTARSRVAH